MYRTRLMIVGPKGSGKTTLRNLLVKPLMIDFDNAVSMKNLVIDTSTKCVIGESRDGNNIPQWQNIVAGTETFKVCRNKYEEESGEQFILEYERNLEEEYHKAISKNIVRELLHQKKLLEDKKRNSAGKGRQLHLNKKAISWRRSSKQDIRKNSDKKDIECKLNSLELPDPIADMVEKLLQEAEIKQDWDKIETEKQPINSTYCSSQVDASIWDWSGDPENFIIQQPFFSSRAVYLVVYDISKNFDLTDDSNQEPSYLSQIHFWLQSIYNHASTNFQQPHVPPNKQENTLIVRPNIVLIGTHKNQLEAESSIRDKVADSKFNRIIDSIQDKAYKESINSNMFALDICDSYCALIDNISSIQSCLESIIRAQWHMGEQVPLKYLAFEQSISKLVENGTNCIDLSRLQTIAESDGITGEDGLKTVLQCFHNLGTLLFFDNVIGSADEGIRNIVVLSSYWLMEAFRSCLYPSILKEESSQPEAQLLESKGKLLASNILKIPGLENSASMIINLLENFELICEESCQDKKAKTEKTYLVPIRVKNHLELKKETQLGEANSVSFYFKFTGFVFDSTTARILTRAIKWCQINCNNGGKQINLFKSYLRFDFDHQHDVKIRIIYPDKIKVNVIRIENVHLANAKDEMQRVNSLKQPVPEICAMVRHFLESSLEDIRVMWEKRMVYQTSVACWCSKDCTLHNRKSCTDDKCQHFLALDECLIKKVIYCGNQRLKTGEIQSWFPEIKYNSKKNNIKASYNLFGIKESHGHKHKWELENSDNLSLPQWTNCAAKFLNAGSEGQDWSALAVKLGYKDKKIGEFQDSMSPAQALIADWIHSSGNTKLSTDMMLSCLEEMHCTEVIDAMKESIVEKNPSPVFISYQWDIQEEVLLIRNQLESHGFSCWMDVGQMGGGDLLYQQIYEGISCCKVMVCCISPKYVVSNTCSREVSLADALKKPVVPVMIKKTTWPPPGAMGLIFSQLVYVSMCQSGGHGGSGKLSDWQTRTEEIILQVSRYISPPIHNEAFARISKSGGRKDAQFHVDEINGIMNENVDELYLMDSNMSNNGYRPSTSNGRHFQSPISVSNCSICSIL